MEDLNGVDLAAGQLVIYSTPYGRSDSAMQYGVVTKLNPKTKKVWVRAANRDGSDKLKRTRDIIRDSEGEYVLSDPNNPYSWTYSDWYEVPVGTTVVNYTHEGRFVVLT